MSGNWKKERESSVCDLDIGQGRIQVKIITYSLSPKKETENTLEFISEIWPQVNHSVWHNIGYDIWWRKQIERYTKLYIYVQIKLNNFSK